MINKDKNMFVANHIAVLMCFMYFNNLNTLMLSNLRYTVFYTGIASPVRLLATSWTVRGSNSDSSEIFRACPDRPWGPSSLLLVPGGKAAGAWR
jgi:hypothetical protein